MKRIAIIPAQSLLEGNVLFSDFEGALTEQYVLQQLKEKSSLSIYYWSAEKSRGEIDLSFIFRICNTRIKKQSSQGCGPQPCELLIVYCKSGV